MPVSRIFIAQEKSRFVPQVCFIEMDLNAERKRYKFIFKTLTLAGKASNVGYAQPFLYKMK